MIFPDLHESFTQNKVRCYCYIPSFCHLVKNQFDTTMKQIRIDNAQEFKLIKFYSSQGIILQLSCIGTSQQNGVIERKHGHLLAAARSLMFQSLLPVKFWRVFYLLHVL